MDGVAIPILLNCWKHHAGFILEQIARFEEQGPAILPQVTEELRVIGNAQMDWYYGIASPNQIGRRIIDHLRQHGNLAPDVYSAWLESNKGYQMIDLGELSQWVVRWGEQPGRYVHIHPARYALDTLRIRAPLLKVAIAVMVWTGIYGGDPTDLAVVNRVRRSMFDLAPVPYISQTLGLGPMVRLLQTLRAERYAG